MKLTPKGGLQCSCPITPCVTKGPGVSGGNWPQENFFIFIFKVKFSAGPRKVQNSSYIRTRVVKCFPFIIAERKAHLVGWKWHWTSENTLKTCILDIKLQFSEIQPPLGWKIDFSKKIWSLTLWLHNNPWGFVLGAFLSVPVYEKHTVGLK